MDVEERNNDEYKERRKKRCTEGEGQDRLEDQEAQVEEGNGLGEKVRFESQVED